MFPRTRPPPMERKPTLPLSFEIQREIPGLPSFEVVTQEFLVIAQTADYDGLMQYMNHVAYAQLRGGPSDLLVMAIDPATGDSAVHRAAAAGNIDFLNTVLNSWGRNFGQVPEMVRRLWVLVTHQNLTGDTALHSAARAGNLKGVKGIYRLFHKFNCLDVDDSLYDDEASWPGSASNDVPAEPPLEYMDYSPSSDDPDANLSALDFVCMKNLAGRDAAGEARVAGHEDLAAWLDRLAGRLDHGGRREDEKYMRLARLTALEENWYHDDKEEK